MLTFWQNLCSDILAGLLYQLDLEYWRHQLAAILFCCGYEALVYNVTIWLADPGSDKKRAWIPSVASSAFLFVTSMPAVMIWIGGWGLFGSAHAGEGLMFADSYSDFLATFFLTFLWIDLLASSFKYPGHMEILSGWIHHISYILLVSNSLKWKWTNALALTFIEEAPTLALGLGIVYPHIFKAEMLFGVTFAIFRLFYHGIITFIAYRYTRHQSSMWMAGFITFAVHCWWFYGWLLRQQRLQTLEKRLTSMTLSASDRDEIEHDIHETRSLKLDSMLSSKLRESQRFSASVHEDSPR